MIIEVLEKTNTMSHSLKKGDVVNMRGVDAQKLIKDKKAKMGTDAQVKAYFADLEKKSKK